MIIQFCGLSGAGKSTLTRVSALKLQKKRYAIEILDGDEYRDSLCNDLEFSKKRRESNDANFSIHSLRI